MELKQKNASKMWLIQAKQNFNAKSELAFCQNIPPLNKEKKSLKLVWNPQNTNSQTFKTSLRRRCNEKPVPKAINPKKN